MNYEQKYKEALDTAKEFYNITMPPQTRECVEKIFPELKIVEEERITNVLYCIIRDCEKAREILIGNGILPEKALDWINEQCEKKFSQRDIDDAYLKGVSDTKHELEKQHTQNKHTPKWNELTWEDINYLEELMNMVHYEFRNGISAEGFGNEVLEKFIEHKEDEPGETCEQKPISSDYNEAFDNFMSHIPEKDPESSNSVYTYNDLLSAIQFGIDWQQQKKSTEWTEEDERMIRIIENAICTNEAQELVKAKYGLELTDLADWLEKQGEQKPTDKVEPKFKEE